MQMSRESELLLLRGDLPRLLALKEPQLYIIALNLKIKLSGQSMRQIRVNSRVSEETKNPYRHSAIFSRRMLLAIDSLHRSLHEIP